MKSSPSTIVWFRQDLRLDDNPALVEAAARGAVVPVFILSPQEEGAWPPGGASRWWLHRSLESLAGALRERGSRLIVRRGSSLESLREIVAATGASAVFWNRRYEPESIERDARVKAALRGDGLEAESFNAALLREPWLVRSGTGGPYRVFTPFWRACCAIGDPIEPVETPVLRAPASWPSSLEVGELDLLPSVDWTKGMSACWTPGEAGARRRLDRFLDEAIDGYAEGRDRPGAELTSRLSPHLHWGEIGPRRVWHETRRRARGGSASMRASAEKFLAEVGWREFAHHLLYHFPKTVDHPLRPEFERFPWRRDDAGLRAWQRGRTGYPLVDAGMRELWSTGWMHNRVRMVAASFLVKHLVLPWQSGAAWFWETLVDADLANNTLGWQWTAGCGADAAPYFRIFNPVAQGERFDADGAYVRRWVPELARLPDEFIHQPWEAPMPVLRSAGVALGESYPRPIVDHREARDRALAALATIAPLTPR